MQQTPTAFILDGDERVIDWIFGYSSVKAYRARLEAVLAGTDTYAALRARLAQDPGDVESLTKLARKFLGRFPYTAAVVLFEKVVELDPGGTKGFIELEAAKRRVTCTEFAEYELAVFASQRPGFDRAPLQAFVKKYPKSPLKRPAEEQIALLARVR